MAERHALVTGPISGVVDTPDPGFPEDTVDVTAPVLYFDSLEHAAIVADAIEGLHVANGSHPLQYQCAYIDDPKQHGDTISAEARKEHKAAHKALRERFPH